MITVFTPTYNREHTIQKLYISLCAQTDKQFEWVVVDDGSTDNTENFFNEVCKIDNGFKIVYEKQANGGKHRAINHGVRLASGELFFIVDSDDYLCETAIEKIVKWRSALPFGEKWAGVSGLKGYSLDETVGGEYRKAEYVDATNIEREAYNLTGDKAEAYFTEILKKYPFPEFEGEKFITEEVVWNAVAADGYKIRWYNEIIYICEYLEDGLTKSGSNKYKNSPQGTLFWARQQIEIFKKNKRKKLVAINCYSAAVKDHKTYKEIAIDLGVSRFNVMLACFLAKIKRILKKL